MILDGRSLPNGKTKRWSVNTAMQFAEAIEHVLSNYAVFSGRARRSEFWYFQLFYYLVLLGLSLLALTGVLAFLPVLYLLGMLIPNAAVHWRRLDRKSVV